MKEENVDVEEDVADNVDEEEEVKLVEKEKEEENSISGMGSLQGILTQRDFEILPLSQLDQEVEQNGSRGWGKIFTSTPVEGEQVKGLEDIPKEGVEEGSPLARTPWRNRKGRARKWLVRLGGRVFEVVATIMVAVV